MSGHSKWSTIKRKKGSLDVKKSKIFSRISKIITIAARDGGKPEMNFKLRLACDKAREVNMPQDNIERAIKKGTGELLGGSTIENIAYEAYGPGNAALIIEVITDNKNRTVSEIKKILSSNGGKLGLEGSVKWMFEKKGVVRLSSIKDKKEEIELLAIDQGAFDVQEEGEELVIYLPPEKISEFKNRITAKNIKIDSAEVELISSNPVKIGDKSILKKVTRLMEELDNQEDVNEIYSNIY